MITLYQGSLRSAQPSLMQAVPIEKVVEQMRSDALLKEETERIRKLRALDPSAADKAKSRLPYFAWNRFDGHLRKKEHFLCSELFCFDIDHYSNKAEDLTELAQEIFKLPSVVMCFRSPSGTGLKVLLRYEPECFSAELYTAMYQACAQWLSEQFGLQGFLDKVTHDVSRICFMAYDEDLLFKLPKQNFNSALWVDTAPWEEAVLEERPMEVKEASPGIALPSKEEEVPQEAVPYEAILQKLRPGKQRIPKYAPTLHADIAHILPDVKQAMQAAGMQLEEEKVIQYGISLVMQSAEGHKAYINVYTGKHGFSLVPQSRKDHHPQFTAAMHALLTEVLEYAQKEASAGGPLKAIR